MQLNTITGPRTADLATTHKELHELVNTLAKSMLPIVVQNKSFIVNNVPRSIPVAADDQVVSSIIGCMLRMMSGRVQNCCIRIEANILDGFVVVQVKDNSGSVNGFITSDLQEAMQYVRKLGWYFSIAISGETATEIALCFPNIKRTVA